MVSKEEVYRRRAYLNKSPRTPIAVTAAPAPAPWTINGRAPYLSVWNMTILSEPPRLVAKGWSMGYLSNPAFTWPFTGSTTPTKRKTCLFFAASFLILSNSASNSGSRAMNPSPVGIPSRAGGMREAVCTDAKDSMVLEGAIVRDRMVSFRATSKPFRSSAGWGSCLCL